MSGDRTKPEGYSRPELPRRRPKRTLGGLYRTPDGGGTGFGGRGVPLHAAEDAVVATVRLAYKVADAQVERSARLASRLRQAGDRAVGEQSDRQALDAAESLVLRAMMSALSWLEGVADDKAPLRRLMTAEYRMIGSLLGLGSAETPMRRDQTPSAKQTEQAAQTAGSPQAPQTAGSQVDSFGAPRATVKHTDESARYVYVRRLQVDRETIDNRVIYFHRLEENAREPFKGELVIDQGAATLTVDAPNQAPAGRWRAAVCDNAVQIGFVEIEI
jgi:hypothetical protein